MKIVIDIPEELYKRVKTKCVPLPFDFDIVMDKAINNGNPYEERSQGKWIKHSTYKDVLICSNCNHGSNQVYDTFNFCPNCGADMRGG